MTLKKEIFSFLLAVLIYAGLVTLLGGHFYFGFMLFWVGGIVGILLLYFDPLVSAYLTSTEAPFSQELKQMIGQKRFEEALKETFVQHQAQEQPLLHSALFQVALTLLAFYVVTSSGSLFGSGLVMGMVLHLVKEEVGESKNPERLNRMLFWNIHREITAKEQKIYLISIFTVFALETLLLI